MPIARRGGDHMSLLTELELGFGGWRFYRHVAPMELEEPERRRGSKTGQITPSQPLFIRVYKVHEALDVVLAIQDIAEEGSHQRVVI